MSMSNKQLEKELTGLYERVAKLVTAMKEGFELRDKGSAKGILEAIKLQDERTDVLSKGVEINGESIKELLKRIEKLEQEPDREMEFDERLKKLEQAQIEQNEVSAGHRD